MKITKSNNIGFDFLEYETIINALYYYAVSRKNFLALQRHILSKSAIEIDEEDIERAMKLYEKMKEARNKYMSGCTNW